MAMRYTRKYGLPQSVINYLNQPLPDISGIFSLGPITYPELGVDSPIVEKPIVGLTPSTGLTEEEMRVLYPQYYPTAGGGDGRDDENVIDTTNNAGIYSLSDVLQKIPTPFNLARRAIENIQNPYTTVFGNLNRATQEAITREEVSDLQNRIDAGEFGSVTPTPQDERRAGQYENIAQTAARQSAIEQEAANREAAREAAAQAAARQSAIAQEAANREAARESAAAAAAAAQAAANRDAARGQTGGGGGGISDSQAEANRDAARGGQSGGGGGGGGGGKIVCTMMNESYGFGSFRNKIWLKHSKSLAPEYQKGYHKIFLPLVKYAKQDGVTNKIVKNILEHIAVHRTIDIRQESRNKIHLLGRIYRKVLEPICYLVGKHG